MDITAPQDRHAASPHGPDSERPAVAARPRSRAASRCACESRYAQLWNELLGEHAGTRPEAQA